MRTDEMTPEEIECALARLDAYERMHAFVLEQYEKFSAQVDERKAAGRMKGATSNQLLAQKMTFKGMLGMYELYDLKPPQAERV